VVREGRLVLQHHGNLIQTHKVEMAAQRESHTLYEVVTRAVRPTGMVVSAEPELQPAVALNAVPVVPAPVTHHTVVPTVATNRPLPAPVERQPEAKRAPAPAPLPETVVTPRRPR
jgi:hypothetical protein